MALMIGAMMIQGIAPGPQAMAEQPELFWGIIASMWIGKLMLVILNLPLIGIWVKLLTVPYRLLYPSILLFCCVGVSGVLLGIAIVPLLITLAPTVRKTGDTAFRKYRFGRKIFRSGRGGTRDRALYLCLVDAPFHADAYQPPGLCRSGFMHGKLPACAHDLQRFHRSTLREPALAQLGAARRRAPVLLRRAQLPAEFGGGAPGPVRLVQQAAGERDRCAVRYVRDRLFR